MMMMFCFQNNPKNLDPSSKMDLEFLDCLMDLEFRDCFGREKPSLITEKYGVLLLS